MTPLVQNLRELMGKADNAILNNNTQQDWEGHLYVKRGDNECAVAKPQCPEWARYLAALVTHGPALLAIVEAAQEVHGRIDAHAPLATADVRALIRLGNALAQLTKETTP